MENLLDMIERSPWLRPRVVLAVALAVAVAVGLASRTRGEPDERRRPIHVGAADPAPAARGRGMLVDVAGAVHRPGVYELREGARVLDAIRAAGGLQPRADIAAVNRAAEVVDGQQVLVPEVPPPVPESPAPATAGGPATATSAARGAPEGTGRRVSLNSADVVALDALPGVGPVTAQHIIDDRTANGPFRTVDELDRVPGIGPGTVERLRDMVGP
jgi:competence protein ComEA